MHLIYEHYSSAQLSKIFGLSRGSICKYLKTGTIPSTRNNNRYLVTSEQLYDLFDKDNRMLYMVQENSNRKAQAILNTYKEMRRYERIYYVYDISILCGLSISWARSLRERGKISGNYIKESEFVDYLKEHRNHVYQIKNRVCGIPHYEALRIYILDRLTKEGFVWTF